MRKLLKGDHVIVITGKDKGKTGNVTKVLDGKVVVEGVNVVKKHQKPNPMNNVAGGIVSKTMPVAISNVAIFNPETKKADRVGIEEIRNEEGKVVERVRIFKSNGARVSA
ncbi:50S ribosomal protein L24 [Neisseriaceae bacterium CLB008]